MIKGQEELISADVREHCAGDVSQALGDLADDLVACRHTVGVVDIREVVKVHHDDGSRLAYSILSLQVGNEGLAVGQFGEMVVGKLEIENVSGVGELLGVRHRETVTDVGKSEECQQRADHEREGKGDGTDESSLLILRAVQNDGVRRKKRL